MSTNFSRPYDFEVVEVTDADVFTLDAQKIKNNDNPGQRQPATSADISVEDEGIRFRIDGGVPDQDTGHFVPAGTLFNVTNAQALLNFKATAIGTGVTGVLQVTYYNA